MWVYSDCGGPCGTRKSLLATHYDIQGGLSSGLLVDLEGQGSRGYHDYILLLEQCTFRIVPNTRKGTPKAKSQRTSGASNSGGL